MRCPCIGGRRRMSRIIVGAIVVLLGAAGVRAQDAVRQDGWVVLPVEEYRALRARAFPSAPDPAPPPVDAALTRVDYDLRDRAATRSPARRGSRSTS